MKTEYQLQRFNDEDIVYRFSDGACIVLNESDRRYKEYLKWLEEGNQPLPADQPSQE